MVLFALVPLAAQAAPPRKPVRPAPARSAPFNANSPDAPRLLNGYARCLADAKPNAAEDLLGLPLLSNAQTSTFKITLSGRDACSGSIPPAYISEHLGSVIGGVAEGLFLSRYGKQSLTDIVARAAGVNGRNDTEELSLCLVRRDAEGAYALVQTRVGTPQEEAALQKLVADLPYCIAPNVTLKLTKPMIRIYAAAGLYLAAKGERAAPAVLR